MPEDQSFKVHAAREVFMGHWCAATNTITINDSFNRMFLFFTSAGRILNAAQQEIGRYNARHPGDVIYMFKGDRKYRKSPYTLQDPECFFKLAQFFLKAYLKRTM